MTLGPGRVAPRQVVEAARSFGTPLYLYDESAIVDRCREILRDAPRLRPRAALRHQGQLEQGDPAARGSPGLRHRRELPQRGAPGRGGGHPVGADHAHDAGGPARGRAGRPRAGDGCGAALHRLLAAAARARGRFRRPGAAAPGAARASGGRLGRVGDAQHRRQVLLLRRPPERPAAGPRDRPRPRAAVRDGPRPHRLGGRPRGLAAERGPGARDRRRSTSRRRRT